MQHGHMVRGLTRTGAKPIAGVEWQAVGTIGPHTLWTRELEGIDVVVHLATSAHRPISPGVARDEPKTAAALLRAAAAAGVGRFVQLSSIRAMGERSQPRCRFRFDDPAAPTDSYGHAKLAIERSVAAAARASGVDLVILRPPLVYGPGVKGNFGALIRIAASGIPLPLGALYHRRSLIYLDNLIDLVVLACTHPAARRRIFLARDRYDLSIPEVLRGLERGLRNRVRLFPVVPGVLSPFCLVPGIGPWLRRLTSPLLVDDSATRQALGWQPSILPEIGLAITARAYARSR